MIEIDIALQSEAFAGLAAIEDLARAACEAALAVSPATPPPPLSVSLLLADDAAVRVLNRDWRGLDKPTNVLSFPAPPQRDPAGLRHLGDIALAFETLAREAEAEGKPLPDHVAHLIVHGVLHLLGHDHEADPEAQIMEALETQALARLKVADPYRDAAA